MFSPTDVVVTVRQARNLAVKSKSGINNAYATIEFLKEKFVTGVEKSLLPRWFTECTFSLPHGGVFASKVLVSICIYHKHHGKLGLEPDEFIGQIQIPLSTLTSSDSKQRTSWYTLSGRKKDSKKERGEVEIAFRFSQSQKGAVLYERKESPRMLRGLTSGIRHKLRRRSDDEDSGLGASEGDSRPQSLVMGKGRSLENLAAASFLDDDGQGFERSFRTSSTNGSTDAIVSARGSVRSLQGRSNLASDKAISVEVLHKPEIKAPASPQFRSDLTVCGANQVNVKGGGGGKLVERFKKKHARNRSLPDSQLASMIGQLRKDEQTQSALCINGSHLYVPGSIDSGNNSMAASPEVKLRSLSMEDVSAKPITKTRTVTTLRNKNTSNSTRRHSLATVEHKFHDHSTISTLYKPKNFYRLDVKELRKVSTIHEDTTSTYQAMTHEQLVKLVQKQQMEISDKNSQIKELENYIDSLLVKVITFTPYILEDSVNVRRASTDRHLTHF